MLKVYNGIFLTFTLLLAILPSNILANYDDISTEDLENLLRDIEYQEELSRNDDYQQQVEPDTDDLFSNFQYDQQLQDVEDPHSYLPSAQIRQEQIQHAPISYGFGSHQINKVKPVNPPSNLQQGGPMRGGPVLPAYCDPPNPCPHGYNEKDGCIEDFDNTSDFSRRYQSQQNCLCDSEHMFNCPTEEQERKENERTFLAGLPPSLDKDFEESNPYLAGTKLPIAAKKGLGFWRSNKSPKWPKKEKQQQIL